MKTMLPGTSAVLLGLWIGAAASPAMGETADNATSGQRAADFGLKPEVQEDQTPALQRFLDATAAAGGGEAYLPAGRYILKGSARLPSGVTLKGAWETPHHGTIHKGTMLLAYGGRGREDGPALLELGPSSAVRGLTIGYPEQRLNDLEPYPWTIHGRGMHNTIENVTLINSWQGIAIGPEPNELHLIRNVFGCVLRRGIFIDRTTDIGRLENVHFNPHYWNRSQLGGLGENPQPNGDIAVGIAMQDRLEAFIFGRTDWQYVLNTFVFAAKVGYKVLITDNGAMNGQFVGIGADACQYGLYVENCQFNGLQVTNGQFATFDLRRAYRVKQPSPEAEWVAVRTAAQFEGVLKLTGCAFWGGHSHVLKLEGSGFVSLLQANINDWRQPDAAVEVLGGRASIRDVWFRTKGTHVRVGPNVKRVQVTGCFAEGGVVVETKAPEVTAVGANE